MRYKNINTNYIIMMLVLLLSASLTGCGGVVNEEMKTSNQEEQVKKEENVSMEHSAELLMNEGGLEEDSAYGTVEQLQELGASPLLTAEVVSKNRGLTLRVVDEEGITYYLGYGGLGYLEIIRLGNIDGKILYAPEE